MEILNPKLDGPLRRAVDAAVAGNASLEAGRQAVYRALDLLTALARDAPRALGEDHEAAERVRLLLSLAAELAAPFHEGEELVSDAQLELEALDEPALIRHGGVVLLGLCAARVGADLALSGAFVDVVFGLALAASSAERLARAVAAGLDAAQLAAALAALANRDPTKSQVAAFLTSLPERRRWLCLVALRKQLLADLQAAAWDATARHGIMTVEPRAACPRQPVVIQVRASEPQIELAASSLNDERAAAWYLPRLVGPGASARVVFAAPERIPVAVPAGPVDLERGHVRAQVPDGATTGWIGFFDSTLRARSNEFRSRLRELWAERNSSEVCLKAAPVPVEEIALLGDPALPPPLASARLRAGPPRIRQFSAHPARLEPGQAALVEWRVDGADEVVLDPPVTGARVEGRAELQLPEGRWLLPITLSAENACGKLEQRALLTRRVLLGPSSFEQQQSGPPLIAGEPALLRSSYAPADANVTAVVDIDGQQLLATCAQGDIMLALPAELIRSGVLQGTLRLFSELPAPPSEDDLQPLASSHAHGLAKGPRLEDERAFSETVVTARARRVVLVRPALLGSALKRVPAAVARAALELAARQRREAMEILELAWIDDAELALEGSVDASFGPNADELLERLEALAVRHPGLEGALWLAVVPAPDAELDVPAAGALLARRSAFDAPTSAAVLSRSESGEGAAALAIASPEGIPSVLEASAAAVTEPATERLRLTGVLHAGGYLQSSARARMERRESGPGARIATGLWLVGLDARGRERVRRPLTVLRRGLPARFSVLLPLPREVVAAEVRALAGERASVASPSPPLLRLYRPEGQLELAPLRLEGNRLHVAHQHSAGARPEMVVEVGSRRVWSPIALVPPCAAFVDLPLDRLAPGAALDAVRLVGTDGWNTDTEELALEHAVPSARALIRRAGDRRLWADVEPALAPVQWQLGEQTLSDPLIELSPDFAGTIVLSARAGADIVEDRLEIGAR